MRPALLAALFLSSASALAQQAPPSEPPAKVLSLEQALRTARENQPQLRQAHASTQAAHARANQSLAPLLPQVSGTASYQRTTANFSARPGSVPSQFSGAGASNSWSTFNFFNFGLSASQLLWDFNRTSGQWEAAKAGAEAQGYSEKTTLQQVLLSVSGAFYNARAQKALVSVAQETLANQQRHLEQTQGFVEVGTRPQIDLAKVRTNVANARVDLVNAQNGYATARAQLNQAMGVEGPTDYDVADNPLPPVEGEESGIDILVEQAIKARPELAALANQIRAQQLTAGAIQGGFWPSLGVSTAFTDAGQDLSALGWNWNAQATVSWQIFQGGLTKAQVAEAEANLRGLRAQLDAERQTVRLELEQARLAVRAAKETLAANAEALTNAREQLRLAEGRYQTGLGSSLELSDAQLALTSVEAKRVQADFSLSSARAQLLKALGRL